MPPVAFQGVEGAYSEAAARQVFGAKVNVLPRREFADVFKAVTAGKVTHGVLPFENSLTGSIHQNYDLVLKHSVVFTGEVKLRVSHCLLAPRGVKLADVREVYSHPQALAQCAGFLGRVKRAAQVPYFDTAGSAAFVAASERRDVAAIASAGAGRRYGLVALRQAIEDDPNNYTRFLVIARKAPPARGKAVLKTSVVFALKSVPGALHKSLSVFALRDVDLLKIESRPIPGSPWRYMFYLDFATPKDPKVLARTLSHLEELTEFLRVLGTYGSAP